MSLLEGTRRAALAAGAAAVGVCDAEPFAGVRDDLIDRVREGHHGGMRFTFADPGTATSVRVSFPWAERLVVVGVPYLPDAGDPGPARPGTGRIARFATVDHYRPVRAALAAAAAVLGAAGHRTAELCDDNRLVDRAAAVRSGIGWWGKNTMVLDPAHGPWMLIGSVVTDAPLPVSEPMVRDCGTCAACLPACPTGALVAPGVLDARRCLAAVLQAPGVIPRPLRPAVGDRIYGCDDCLDACPPGHKLLGRSRSGPGRIDVIGLLGAADRVLASRYDHFYIPRRRVRYLRRNALVALGNAPAPGSVAVLAGFLGHPDWLLRLHAAWALDRTGGGRALLRTARAAERHPDVTAELDACLSGDGA